MVVMRANLLEVPWLRSLLHLSFEGICLMHGLTALLQHCFGLQALHDSQFICLLWPEGETSGAQLSPLSIVLAEADTNLPCGILLSRC